MAPIAAIQSLRGKDNIMLRKGCPNSAGILTNFTTSRTFPGISLGKVNIILILKASTAKEKIDYLCQNKGWACIIWFLNSAKRCYIPPVLRSVTGISMSSNSENNRLGLHVKDSISTKPVLLYVTLSDCLTANLAGNKMLTEQLTLFCAQQKFIRLVSAESYFIYKIQQD